MGNKGGQSKGSGKGGQSGSGGRGRPLSERDKDALDHIDDLHKDADPVPPDWASRVADSVMKKLDEDR